ncbi:MAG: hypothetical protein KAT04_10030 [Methylococcales bacterium]|nr:hypothetical protein [Methylococcales bacterium]
MASYYSIYISTKKGIDADKVEDKMDLALDWFRLNTSYWVVYTSSDANKWQERLQPLVEPGGNLFICRLDTTDRQGWISKEFWKWLKEKR